MPPTPRKQGPPRAPHPTKAEVQAAVEQSAEHLAAQSEPPTDVHPGPTTPSKADVNAAVEQSAEFLAAQSEPPSDVHPGPTTPTKAEVKAAVEQSAENLEGQGVIIDTSTAGAPPAGPASAAPVAAGGNDAARGSAPVPAGRDRSMDAAPVFESPIPDRPRD